MLQAQPQMRAVELQAMRDERLCPLCKAIMDAQRRGMNPIWPEL
ncbi:hypothetical protein PSYPI_33398 [Pseudomonas syringae pv. pisi str. 1704B]|uniref:Uncharacterized protein n=1 Tax=Pseudomonas syringae pv. pisi str. 1704B TaxID=629263 RepID=F3GIL9_PSESJ|nr:hypothetical protein PSYPI_33398 [Pseudomonas syringae pv. pisi str. 1704B]